MKKWIIGGTALVLLCGSVFGFNTFYNNNLNTNAEEITKEVTVEFGNVTAGITESAAVSVESLEQMYDLTLTSTNISASVESKQSSSGNTGGMSGMGGMNTDNMVNMNPGTKDSDMGKVNVFSNSESGSVELVVDKICVTEGQSVKKGDELMTITQDSIDEAGKLLKEAVTDAKLALKQAQIDEKKTLLSAKYDYDTRIAEGENARAAYSAALAEIAQNITELKSQISSIDSQKKSETDSMKLTQLESERKQLQAQLDSAESSRSADELAAKQSYDEAVMYYENAQSLYDVAVNDVGNATAEAKKSVSTAKSDLKTFEAYVKDGSIYAKYSGTITGIGYSSGDALSSETAIASFADAESITVTVNVTEDDISAVELDETVEVDFLSYPDEIYSGYVSKIGSSSTSSDSSNVSYPVTIVITNVPKMVLSGLTANVTFITKQVKDVLYTSNKAIITDGTEQYVIRKKADGSEERVAVKIGFSNGNISQIEGVSKGDTLLIKGKEQ